MSRKILLAIQGLLLVIGSAALSASTGGFLVFLMMSCVFPQPRGESWGGAPAWFFAMSCGGLLAGLAGASGAILWLGRHGSRVWKPFTWLGVAAGLAVALTLSAQSFNYEFNDEWLGWTAFRLTTLSTIGGFLATLIQQFVRHESKPPHKTTVRRRKRSEQ